MEDVFDEESTEVSIGEKNWIRTRNALQTSGYKDGVATGENTAVQTGFDLGYSHSAKLVAQIARLRGKISAKAYIHHANEDAKKTFFESLQKKVTVIEESCIKLNHEHSKGTSRDSYENANLHFEGCENFSVAKEETYKKLKEHVENELESLIRCMNST